MFTNIIQPQKISLQNIIEEIAKAAKTTVEKIIKIECWQHQIWVNITGKGGKFISYRSLKTYIHQGLLLIKNCQTWEQLQQLGEVFKLETQRFPQYYATEFVEQLRSTWAKKRDEIKQEEKRTEPMRKHKQEAQEWLESWQNIISHCHTIPSLQHAYPMLEQQSKEFEDLPDIIEQLLNFYQQRWNEINQKSQAKS